MKKERIAFNEMYSNISEDWGLNKDEVDKIINMYTDQLITEILDDTPFTISPYFMDYRSPEEYCYDLLSSRIFEDFICLWFTKHGHEVKKIGDDKDGTIHRSNKGRITNKPDINVDGKDIEIQISAAGRRKIFDVKENKGKKILAGENILMFIVNDEYLIIDKEALTGAKLEANFAWGGKMTYRYKPELKDYCSIKNGGTSWLLSTY